MDKRLHILDDNWKKLNEFLSKKTYSKIFVLVDSNTYLHCLPKLSVSLEQDFQILEIEPGEASKDLEICFHLWSELSEEEADRNSLLINLGGGVVSDLGGFIASIYKRGIDFIHIPTSLLSMIDASIGGKCGIDFLSYKNQLGIFQEANGVFIDTNFLKTLPEIEMESGFAEMLKHGLIADKKHWIELSELKVLTTEALSEKIPKSMQIKESIVRVDPFEKGERKKLNFGHTIGHAIESHYLSKEQAIPHGFAIAAGMFMESYLSWKKGLLAVDEYLLITDVIASRFPKLHFSKDDIPAFFSFMKQDKKSVAKIAQFTLLTGIGDSVINQSCEDQLILASFQYYLNAYGA